MADRNNEKSSDRRSETHRVPFDTSDLRKLHYPTKDDPPYRPFWIDDQRLSKSGSTK